MNFTHFNIFGLRSWLFPAVTLGQKGERHAAKYLKQQGMKILARNVHSPHGEIDIIALDNKTIVIAEVRTLSDDSIQRPEQSIRQDKKRHVLSAANWFVRSRRLQQFSIRIDVVAIVWPPGGKPHTTHFKDAFRG